jgi:hypothetical protein
MHTWRRQRCTAGCADAESRSRVGARRGRSRPPENPRLRSNLRSGNQERHARSNPARARDLRCCPVKSPRRFRPTPCRCKERSEVQGGRFDCVCVRGPKAASDQRLGFGEVVQPGGGAGSPGVAFGVASAGAAGAAVGPELGTATGSGTPRGNSAPGLCKVPGSCEK